MLLASIIIVHWNTPKTLYRQLELFSKFSEIEIIVISNSALNELTFKIVDYPKIKFIQNHENKGYAFACNQGINIAKSEWVYFLNPDIHITEQPLREWLSETINKSYVASSLLPSRSSYLKPVPSFLSLLVEFTPLKYLVPLSVFYEKTLIGGALLIKKSIIVDMGGWDERFFIWFEDSDLTKRLILKRYKIGFINVKHSHLGGESFESMSEKLQKDVFFHSMNVYANKHFGFLGKLITRLLRRRYSSAELLPIFNVGLSITIPNIKKDILDKFLEVNKIELNKYCEVIIVSNSLNPEDIWDYRRKYPKIRFILIDFNYGFSHTVNIGFNVSSTPWIGTVNDDVTLSENWAANCINCNNNLIGSVNPVIYSKNGDVESAGISILKFGKASPNVRHKTENLCDKVDATNAAAVIYSQLALNRIGLFDERFHSYLEDIDISLRLNRAGYLNLVSYKSSVIHLGRATSLEVLKNKKKIYDFRNWIYIICKNWSLHDIVIYFPQILIERIRNLSGLLKSFHTRKNREYHNVTS